jgi:hypothetical protein
MSKTQPTMKDNTNELGLDSLGGYGKNKADRLRAKRIQLLREKQLAFETEQKPTRRDYALEREMIRERMAQKEFEAEQEAQRRQAREDAAAAVLTVGTVAVVGGVFGLLGAVFSGLDKALKGGGKKRRGRGRYAPGMAYLSGLRR